MYQKIDEELRQYKLFKIQETENKLKKYNKVYNEIKQNKDNILMTKYIEKNLNSININKYLILLGSLYFFDYDYMKIFLNYIIIFDYSNILYLEINLIHHICNLNI